MQRRFSAALLALALTAAALPGCQGGEAPEPLPVDPPAVEEPAPRPETPPETPPPADEPAGTPEEAPAPPAEPVKTDYYFMGSLYGLRDYPSPSTLLESPDALARLKQFYAGLQGIADRVEYHTQSLEYVGEYTGALKFSGNGETNGPDENGVPHTQLKTLFVGRSEYDAFDGVLAAGRNFTDEDFTVSAADDVIPVLLGYDYAGVYQLGDTLTLSLHMRPLQFEVAGFLEPNAVFRFDQEIPLDQHIIVPFYDIAYEPADEADRYCQTIYYLQKCEGFVAVSADADAEQIFRGVEALARQCDLLFAVTPVKRDVYEAPPAEGRV